MAVAADMFGGLIRMLMFGWGAEGVNPFQKDTLGRLVKSENPADEKKTQGESISEPLECLSGTSKLEKRAQAALIRRDVKAVLTTEAYAVIELRLCVPVDHESAERKLKALNMVASQAAMMKSYPIGYIKLVCALWGGEPVKPGMLIPYTSSDKAPNGSRSTEDRWRNDLIDYLDLVFDEVVDTVRRRL